MLRHGIVNIAFCYFFLHFRKRLLAFTKSGYSRDNTYDVELLDAEQDRLINIRYVIMDIPIVDWKMKQWQMETWSQVLLAELYRWLST